MTLWSNWLKALTSRCEGGHCALDGASWNFTVLLIGTGGICRRSHCKTSQRSWEIQRCVGHVSLVGSRRALQIFREFCVSGKNYRNISAGATYARAARTACMRWYGAVQTNQRRKGDQTNADTKTSPCFGYCVSADGRAGGPG